MNSKIEEESSGEPNAGLVIWHDWDSHAFELARQRNQPVILSIGAVWCYWCGVMQDTTFSDPDVVEFVNSNFVCVRVDNDHRPDINSRYNVGGWPTTAFHLGDRISDIELDAPGPSAAELTDLEEAVAAEILRLGDAPDSAAGSSTDPPPLN